MPVTHDDHVLIVGGAIIGSAVAAFLAESGFAGRITVVERDPGYRFCSTTLSASSLRQQFSTPVNVKISQFGAAFLRELGRRSAALGDPVDPSFNERGYLFLASEAGREILEANHRVQMAEGADVALLDPSELAGRYPWLSVDDLAMGSLGLSTEGWFDAYTVMQWFRRRAISLGVEYRTDEVIGLERDGRRIVAARLATGGRVAADTVVNAAGPAAARVAAMAGLDLPVRPRKRSVFVFDCRTPVPGLPLLIDPSGVYVRPEGPSYICGVSPPADRDPDCTDFDVDHWLFEEIVWPTLAHRVPAFEAIKVTGYWAGHYAYNTFDQNAILGPHPEIENLILANGFSGHGVQQAPAVGRGLAEWICYGEYRSLDLSPLGYGRLERNEPLIEQAVV